MLPEWTLAPRGRQGPQALHESLEEATRVRLDRDVHVRRPAPTAPPVGHRLAGREGARQLHVDGQGLGAHEGGIERGRHGQRIVDEGAVEPVEAGVELHVEAQRIGHEAQHAVRIRRPPRLLVEALEVLRRELGALGHVEAEGKRPRR